MPTEQEVKAAVSAYENIFSKTAIWSREQRASAMRAALTAAEEVRGQAVPDDAEFKWHQLDAAEVFATNKDRKA